MTIELIPSAKRLIRSLRDIGYEFVDAVADIVDNSVEAQATVVSINLRFDGEDSYLTISDNGIGMAPKDIQEALRFGSSRAYKEAGDLGRYGLGLKTASLSQCERLTVSSRRGEERARINSYCWDLAHIELTNRWELLKVDSEHLPSEAWTHLQQTTGTVVTWERLGRLMGYRYPAGEHARKQAKLMADSLKIHLGMVFHKFLAGEVYGKRIAIYVNDERVTPWDPYSRGEKHTQQFDEVIIPLEYDDRVHSVRIQPYILPPQSLYSSHSAHLKAAGPSKWNRQQGLYIYRSHRIIQAGGWSGLRTSDEHTKLIRIAVFIPSQLDELFQVNVAKKHLTLPLELRGALVRETQPIIHRAQETYRERTVASALETSVSMDLEDTNEKIAIRTETSWPEPRENVQSHFPVASPTRVGSFEQLVASTASKAGFQFEKKCFHELMNMLLECADRGEKIILHKVLAKYLADQNAGPRSERNR